MTRTWLIPLVALVAGCGATTPLETARQATVVRSSWGAPEEASVAAVRQIVVNTRGPAAHAIARCEAAAGVSRAAYIRCALPTLAQLGSSGELNAMLLLRLSGGASPGCVALIHSLAGAEGTLGTIAREALREELVRGPRWTEVAHAARAIRALAAQSRRVAGIVAWREGCRAQPAQAL